MQGPASPDHRGWMGTPATYVTPRAVVGTAIDAETGCSGPLIQPCVGRRDTYGWASGTPYLQRRNQTALPVSSGSTPHFLDKVATMCSPRPHTASCGAAG